MQTIWKGTISFGLVSIPVKLYAATEDKDIKLTNLHNKCKNPIKQKRMCPICNEEVAYEDLVKAYEYADGKYIVLDKEELEKVKQDEEQDKAVKILDFVKLEEIDPLYFDKGYYLQADANGNKAYALLRESLQTTGKIGLAKITIRSKERLAAIRVFEDYLVLETLHYPDEVRSVADIPKTPQITLIEKEKDIAILLINQLTTPFEPAKYTDTYRINLQQLIDEKIAKEKGVQPAPTTNVINLMEALEASLEATKPKKPRARASKTTKKA
ncbi:Ku protein [Ectobacillus polymachus]|uniref:non-homologous end joining protein Ku n=1 Tax=Ectobacillus polymachus TaxID=1508806 RepID=UPI003A87604D